MPTNKLKAFTLQELLVVLVLTSIVIAITMVVLNLVQGQIKNSTRNYKKAIAVRMFENILAKDMDKYEFAYDESSETLMGEGIDTKITYRFYDSYVLRGIDTFAVKVTEKQFLFKNQKVSKGRIDAVDITVNAKPLFFTNTTHANYFMQNLWHLR